MKDFSKNEVEKVWEKIEIFFSKDTIKNEDILLSMEKTKIEEISEKEVLISTPTKIDEVLLNNDFNIEIKNAFSKFINKNLKIKFIYKEKYKELKLKEEIKKEKDLNFIKSINNSLNKKFTFDNFIFSKKNKMLEVATKNISKGKNLNLNPFFIHGKSGLGKTHILHAIGNESTNFLDFNKIKYIEAKDFGNLVVKAMSSKNINKEIEKINEEFENYNLLIIDDIQFIQSRKKTKEIFFNIFNHFIKNNKQIIVASDQNPEELKDFEERFITRFKSGLLMKIVSPDEETINKILKTKIKENEILNKFEFEEKAIEWICKNFNSNIRYLEGALNTMSLFLTEEEDKIVNKNMLKEIFSDTNDLKDNSLNENIIINKVCKEYSITKKELLSKTRKKEIVIARNIAIFLIRNLLEYKLEQIGKIFKKDHSTIINSIKKIDSSLKTNEDFKIEIEELKIKLRRGY